MPINRNQNSGFAVDSLVASGVQTVSGVSAAQSSFAQADTLVIQLDVTAASGTTPTLDVVVEDTVDGTNYATITGGVFAQKVTTGREVLRLSVPFTDTLRVRWTIAGTTPAFTFGVSVYSEI